MYGSTDSHYSDLRADAVNMALIGVDGSEQAEIMVEDANFTLYLTGYVTSGAVFFTDSVNKATSTTGSYVDVDITGDLIPGDDANGAIVELHLASNDRSNAALRPNGLTYDFYNETSHGIQPIGIDANDVFEQKIQDNNYDAYLVGYTIIATATPTPTPTATSTGVGMDTTTSGQTTGGSSITISHTTSGTNRLMLVGISINNDGSETVSSVTWKGTENLSLFDTVSNADDARVEIWQLVNPSTGTGDVVITFSASLQQGAVAGVTTFTGVNQSTPLGTFASATGDNSSPATVDVTSATGELVYGVVCVEYEPAITDPSQTELWNRSITGTTGSTNGAASTEAGTGPTVTTSWTISDTTYEHWAVGGVSINPP
jgi:hypothetical protein